MGCVVRGGWNCALSCLLAVVAIGALLPAHAATVDIDLDDDPSNGAESQVKTNVLQSFPVMIENVVFNNATGTGFTFDWEGAGPGGFDSILTPGPDVGTKWEWSTVSQVYSISTPAVFSEEAPGIPAFGGPAGGFVTPGGGPRVFTLPGKSIFPGQVTVSTASLTASLITFFSPENTIASCESNFTPGVYQQTITNNSGQPLTMLIEQFNCCLEPNQIICDDGCQSYLTDDLNCGGCGNVCADDHFCDAGSCEPRCPGEGQAYCDGECFDTLNDDTNCGGCGIVCVEEDFCDGGSCEPRCPGEGQAYCDGECFDTLNDDTNCGGCGIVCVEEDFCDGGSCEPRCPGEGQAYCDGLCYDTLTDDTNCGGCGIVCVEEDFCDGGTCEPRCPGEGQAYCDGLCYDTLTDDTNCGGCGIVCVEEDFCDGGTCEPRCPGEGQAYCDGLCYDTLNDNANCGGCGVVCADEDFCASGFCEPRCPGEGQAYCDGLCYDTLTDDSNCGGCGIVCADEDFCASGLCEPRCPGEGQAYCDGVCADTLNDSLNCGGCGITCAVGDYCNSGTCVPSDDEGCDGCGPSPPTGAPEPLGQKPGPNASGTPPAPRPHAAATQPVAKRQASAATAPVVSRKASASTPPVASPPASAMQPVATSQASVRSRPSVTRAAVGSSSRRPAIRAPRHSPRVRTSRLGSEDRLGTPNLLAGIAEAPVCEFQDPIGMTIPDGESYTQCQTGPLVGTEVFTRASIFRGGELVGIGPCAVVVPASDITVGDFYATTSSVVVVDHSGDGLLQPGETADLYLGLLNVGPLELIDPIATLSGPPDQFNPLPVSVISDTAFFPDFPAFENTGDCETPPVLEPQTNLTPFTIQLPEDQESDVARPLQLSIHGCNDGCETFEMPIIVGIGEKCDPTDLDGETYDGLDGFLPPLNIRLVPRGNPVHYSSASLNQGGAVPLKLRLKCGNATLHPNDIDPKPEIVSIVHETLGPQSLQSINDHNNSNPDDPFFDCGTSRCEFGLRTDELPVGTYVIGVKMPDSRVFEAGITLVE